MSIQSQLRELTTTFPADGPGGVIAIARGGVIEAIAPFGMASVEHQVPNTAETVFYIASTSKQFVAAAVAVLELDGALSAHDPVAKWLPEVEQLGDIRVHHLVHHTSGIRDKYSLGAIGALPEEAYATDEGTLALLRRQRTLNFPPGERFEYSNSGYLLLALLVERVSGKSFIDFTTERLFAPLGMRETRFRKDTSEVIPHRASGYGRDAITGAPTIQEYTWTSLGPGGVITTAASLARWGLVWQDGSPLPGLAEQLRIRQPFTDGSVHSYAYGVMLGEHAGHEMIRHAGGVQGFSAEMIQLPSERLTVVALCNSAAIPAPLLADQALALLVPPSAPASESTPAMSGVPTADEMTGVYLSRGEGGVVTVTQQDDGLLATIGPAALPLARTDAGWTAPNGWRLGLEDSRLVVAGALPLSFDRLAESEQTLTDLAGEYDSDELDTIITITENDGVLAAVWPDREPKVLERVSGDLYVVPLHWPGQKGVIRFIGAGSRAHSMQLGLDRAVGTILTRI